MREREKLELKLSVRLMEKKRNVTEKLYLVIHKNKINSNQFQTFVLDNYHDRRRRDYLVDRMINH